MRAANDNAVAAQQPAGAEPLRFLSVCSGIEAASVAWHPLGWKAVAYSEIEKFPSAVLAHHYPDVQNLGDFTKIDVTTLGRVDILAGGTPCQAFSVAGLRQGLDDARGNLTLKFVELAHDLADGNGLRNVVWENVVGVLSDKGNAFGCFLAGLVGADAPIVPPGRWTNAGMVSGPRGRAAWRVLDAQYFGLAQRRKRVIVVADFGNGADPAAVLFEPESVRRDSPPSRETGQGVAPTISARTKGGGGLGTDFDLDGGLIAAYGGNRTSGPLDVATAVNAHGGPHGRLDFESETFVVGVTGDISQALKAEGVDAIEDGTGRGTPIVVQSDVRVTLGGDKAPQSDSPVAIAFDARQTDVIQYGAISGPMDTKQPGPTALIRSAVRRLTPRECERLQGFPDDYTLIPYRNKPAADGPRYKALGNSWAVPKFAWLGRRIEQHMPANDHLQQDAA